MSYHDFHELIKRREIAFSRSEAAIQTHTEEYMEIQKIASHVVNNPVDIEEYYHIAKKLSDLLETMGKETIFYQYFYTSISPLREGKARFFRKVCKDLLMQIRELNQWRLEKRQIKIVE